MRTPGASSRRLRVLPCPAVRSRLAALEATRERDAKTAARRRRNAVATRRAQTRLARVDKELRGPPRHCFGGRKLLRQERLDAWRARRDGNALFAGETGKAGGNEVARWDWETERLVVKLPGGLPPVVLDGVCFNDQVTEDLKACMKVRTPVTWRVKLLSRGRVECCVTYDEPVPVIGTDAVAGALALDLARQTGASPEPVPARCSPRCGTRHRASRPGVCATCVEARCVPRARRREAPGYAWRGEHGCAMAAPRVAPGWSGRCTTKTRGS